MSSSNQVPPSSNLSTLDGEPPSVEETDGQTGQDELGSDWRAKGGRREEQREGQVSLRSVFLSTTISACSRANPTASWDKPERNERS